MNRTLPTIGLAIGLCAAAALAVGCEEPPKGSPASGSAAPVAAAPLTDQDVPLPSDFDDEAEKSISVANYKAEADAIEKEIDSP